MNKKVDAKDVTESNQVRKMDAQGGVHPYTPSNLDNSKELVCPVCGVPAESKKQLGIHISMRGHWPQGAFHGPGGILTKSSKADNTKEPIKCEVCGEDAYPDAARKARELNKKMHDIMMYDAIVKPIPSIQQEIEAIVRQVYEAGLAQSDYQAPTATTDQLLHLFHSYSDAKFREGQLDCKEHGDPRNHKHFKEASDARVREELAYICESENDVTTATRAYKRRFQLNREPKE